MSKELYNEILKEHEERTGDSSITREEEVDFEGTVEIKNCRECKKELNKLEYLFCEECWDTLPEERIHKEVLNLIEEFIERRQDEKV